MFQRVGSLHNTPDKSTVEKPYIMKCDSSLGDYECFREIRSRMMAKKFS